MPPNFRGLLDFGQNALLCAKSINPDEDFFPQLFQTGEDGVDEPHTRLDKGSQVIIHKRVNVLEFGGALGEGIPVVGQEEGSQGKPEKNRKDLLQKLPESAKDALLLLRTTGVRPRRRNRRCGGSMRNGTGRSGRGNGGGSSGHDVILLVLSLRLKMIVECLQCNYNIFYLNGQHNYKWK